MDGWTNVYDIREIRLFLETVGNIGITHNIKIIDIKTKIMI